MTSYDYYTVATKYLLLDHSRKNCSIRESTAACSVLVLSLFDCLFRHVKRLGAFNWSLSSCYVRVLVAHLFSVVGRSYRPYFCVEARQ
jgi:hypothetical protein